MVEKEHMGGVCLNWGCIPTKSLIRNAEIINLLNDGKTFGFKFDNLQVDYGVAHKRSRQVSQRLIKGIGFLMKKNNIDVLEGLGTLKNATEVEVNGEIYTAKNSIIATGTHARVFPGIKVNGKTILTAHEALEVTEAPKSMVVIGAGAIGMEFSYIFNSYETSVTVVEVLPHALPLEDEDVGKEIEKQFGRAGITVKVGTKVEKVDDHGDSITVTVSKDSQIEKLKADMALVSIGVGPNSQNIGLENVGVATDEGGFIIHKDMKKRYCQSDLRICFSAQFQSNRSY